jgi:hypothetical protein
MKKYVSLVCFSLLLSSLVCFVGCGSSGEVAFAQGGAGGGSAVLIDPALAGRWVYAGKGVAIADKIDLLKDGTAIEYRGDGTGSRDTWRAENGRLYLQVCWEDKMVWDYTISGTTLTLTTPDGKFSTTYKKQ